MLYIKLSIMAVAIASIGADTDLDTAPPWIQAGAVAVLATLSIMEQRSTRKTLEAMAGDIKVMSDRQRRRMRISNDSNDPIDKGGV